MGRKRGTSPSQHLHRLKVCVHAAQSESHQPVSVAQWRVAVVSAAVKKDHAALKHAEVNAKVAPACTPGQGNRMRLSRAPAMDRLL